MEDPAQPQPDTQQSEPTPVAEPALPTEPKKEEAPDVPSAPAVMSEEVKKSRFQAVKSWIFSHKKICLPALTLAVLIIIAGVPWTRYHAAGLVFKQNVTVKVVDSATGAGVFDATVTTGGVSAKTDGSGNATLRVKDGWHEIEVTKTYYQASQLKILAPIFKQKSVPSVSLTATGRKVGVTVRDVLSKDLLSGVKVEIAGATAITDDKGSAIAVVAAGKSEEKAILSLGGYNTAVKTIEISAQEIKENSLTLTPAGRLFYLSNDTGTMNVMSSNLDGSDAKVQLAGTGNEDPKTTALYTSPSNKYAALLTTRTSDNNPQLYLINTSSGKVAQIEQGLYITLHGWLGDHLIYSVTNPAIHSWQNGQTKLKSYSTASERAVILNQTSAIGNSTSAASEYYDLVSLYNNTVIYTKIWQQDYELNDVPDISSKSNSLNSILADGSGARLVAKYSAAGYLSFRQYSPDSFYVMDAQPSGSRYYSFKAGGGVAPVAITNSQFDKEHPIYYLTSDNKRSVWSEKRNSKEYVFVGDAVGGNAKAVATLDGYFPIGWYNDQYILLTKSNNELYVMSTSGGAPVKAGDYQSNYDMPVSAISSSAIGSITVYGY